MTFWKTVGSVIVGNLITGLIGFVLLSIGLVGVLSGAAPEDSSTISVPDNI